MRLLQQVERLRADLVQARAEAVRSYDEDIAALDTIIANERRRAAIADAAAEHPAPKKRDDPPVPVAEDTIRSDRSERTSRMVVRDLVEASPHRAFTVQDMMSVLRAEGFTANDNPTRALVAKMVKAGQLVNVGRGLYQSPSGVAQNPEDRSVAAERPSVVVPTTGPGGDSYGTPQDDEDRHHHSAGWDDLNRDRASVAG